MLGLFMILPVFALYAEGLEGVTPLGIGLAISAYGLTQALLQIPFGLASDHIGRKPVIVFGMLLFALGSVVAGLADTIDGVIFGRALQGSGAVAAAVMALAADLTRDAVRTRVMATIGVSIGVSFMLALIAGPLLDRWIGVPGIFMLTALLALFGIAVVLLLVPSAPRSVHHDAEAVPGEFHEVLASRDLLRLDVGILILHMILTASFVVLPLELRDVAGLPGEQHWQIYLPVLLLSLALMVPFVILAERRGRMKPVFVGAIAMLMIAQLGLAVVAESWFTFGLVLVVMFAGFNVLEASLPSLVSKVAPAARKGTAMGVYTTSQFFGAFLGGIAGGAVAGWYGNSAVFVMNSALALLWLLVTVGMRMPGALQTRVVHVGRLAPEAQASLTARIGALPGVVEAVVVDEEGALYIKVDRARFDDRLLDEFSAAST